MSVLKASFCPQRSRIPRPFLKWAGGKNQLLPVLLKKLPKFTGRYHEPFVGGGALFFELANPQSRISDLNQELIDCYTIVRDQPEALISILKEYIYTKDFYYSVRAKLPEELDIVTRAARTIYLNRTGFNGLYRVNSKGLFNVPMGRYKNPRICNEENLLGCAKALKSAIIECCSFETVLDVSKPGDFVYLDPPYIPLSNTANFTAYEKSGFGMENQEKLRDVFAGLTEKGVFAMLSNAFVPWIETAYAAFNIYKAAAVRLVNSDATKRGEVTEVVVTNYKNDRIID